MTPKKLKIGFVVDDRLDKPDGVQQYVKQLGGWLTNHGHNVHYLAGSSPNSKLQQLHGLSRTVKVRFNKNRLAIPLPASNKQIKRILNEQRFDVLHVQMPYSPLLAGKVINAAFKSTAVVGTFHILPYAKTEQWATKALGLLLARNKRRFDQIFSVTTAAQDFAKSSFGVESIVLPNVVNMRDFLGGKTLARYGDRNNIVFLGRLVPRKGAKQLLDAYGLLTVSDDFARNNRIIICGDGPEKIALEKQAAILKQKNHSVEIIFSGFITEGEKKDYLATADVAVFPSIGGESFGIVLLEAMAAGSKVVLAGNNPGYSSVFSDVPEALFVPNESSALAALLAKAIGDKGFIQNLRARQKKLVEQYDVEVVGPKLVKYYIDAIAARRKQEHNN